ncbi:hypothetical protein X739_28815 [Mesorhizobium sp. LNHC220B00]|nr:hypothetical protein X739_28815 [Mesorhizobium sp. LNHC220B00]
MMFLAGIEVLKERAIQGGYPPAFGALYSHPAVLKSSAIFPDMYTAATNPIIRPSRFLGPRYDKFTSTIREEVDMALRGNKSPKAAAEAIRARLKAIRVPLQR